jgi:hypothetical protein
MSEHVIKQSNNTHPLTNINFLISNLTQCDHFPLQVPELRRTASDSIDMTLDGILSPYSAAVEIECPVRIAFCVSRIV